MTLSDLKMTAFIAAALALYAWHDTLLRIVS